MIDVGALELRPIHEEEMTKIDHFIKQTCGCKNNNGGPCSDVLASKFSLLRAQCAELDKTSLDYVMLEELMAMTKTSDITSRKHPSKTRERQSYDYCHEGVKVHHMHHSISTMNFYLVIMIRFVERLSYSCMVCKQVV